MELRTARRGRRAGQQFWGCVRYPQCKGTIDYLSSGTEGPESPQVSPVREATLGSYPVVLSSAPRDESGKTSFFQAAGLPAVFLDAIREAEIDRGAVRSAAQWRLDSPLPCVDEMGRDERALLAVAEAVLTRGATPLCSVAMERAFVATVDGPTAGDELADALHCVATWPSCTFLPLSHESQEERLLADWVHGLCTIEGLPWMPVPQIELASLANSLDVSRAQRGDLLLLRHGMAPLLVEVDGVDHEAHRERDAERDHALSAAGVRVVRVPTAELVQSEGASLEALRAVLREGRTERRAETSVSRCLRWCKFTHQIQLALLAALRGGWLKRGVKTRVGIKPPGVLAADPQARALVQLATESFLELLKHLASLQAISFTLPDSEIIVLLPGQASGRLDVVIGPADGSLDGSSTDSAPAKFLISDLAFPGEIRAPLFAAAPAKVRAPLQEDARWFLQYLFRKDIFWEGQWETVERTLRGEDSVVLLPTGRGKSIAFQLAAMLLPGRCVVVDPIISLIDDQIDNLAAVGIDRAIGITSQLHTRERERALQEFRTGHYLFCFVAPERFQSTAFRESLRALTAHTPISVVVIDEAHCVSEWGHDFRTAYLNLGRVAREYCESQGMVPPLVALTGTASRVVLKDVQRELDVTAFDSVISPKSFDRPELRFHVLTCRSDEKTGRVEGFLGGLPSSFAIDRSRFFRASGPRTNCGLVFCPHIDGPYGIVEFASQLTRSLGTMVDIYAGGPPNSVERDTWDVRKRQVASQYKRNHTSLLACTKAFGMGIDKPNIRYTVHVGLPGSIESFYQEAGRAGRDRRRAECAIVLSNDNPSRSQRLLSPEVALEEVAAAVQATERKDEDDIVRALWFHVRAFRGEQADVQDITLMGSAIGDLGPKRLVNVSWDPWRSVGKSHDDGRQRAEKALHRLVVLGVVQDYTVDYSAHEFGVRLSGAASREEVAAALGRYAGAYQRRLGEEMEQAVLNLQVRSHGAMVLAAAELLVSFIYERVELARRRALSEMLQAANRAATGEDLRQRILDYLEQSEWDERLEQVRSSGRGGVDALSPILDELVSPNDAASLRGAVARLLGSYPDAPGLLLLRAVAEVLCSDADVPVVHENVGAALHFGFRKFRLAPAELATAVGQLVWRARDKGGAGATLVGAAIRAAESDRVFVRELLPQLPIELAGVAADWLNQRLIMRCSAMLAATGG